MDTIHPPPPSIHPTVCSNTILRFPIRAKVVPTDKSHRTCQCHLLGAAIICIPYIQSRMQTCRKSSMAGNDAPDPLSQQLARWEWLKKEIWDCWEKGAENGGAQVVQLLQPDLPKLVLHLRLNESQESCRCPQQQQRHVIIWPTLQQCIAMCQQHTFKEENEKMSPTPQIQYARQKNRCDKDANKEICNGILRFKTRPRVNCATGLAVI